MTIDIDTKDLNILTLNIQRNCLLDILESFDNDILNGDSLYGSATGDSDYIEAGIRSTLATIESLIKATQDALEQPDQINEANWDRH